MLNFLKQYRAFIITLITGVILCIGSAYLVLADIFGNDIKIITPIAIAIWLVLCFPFGLIFDHLFNANSATFTGVWIDIVLYSFLAQFLWNKWRKRKQSQPKS